MAESPSYRIEAHADLEVLSYSAELECILHVSMFGTILWCGKLVLPTLARPET